MNLNDREKKLFSILAVLILSIVSITTILYFTKNQLSKYANKTFVVRSIDGKITGTIKTSVEWCSESSKCVRADYRLILVDNIPPKKANINTRDSYFDPNYFYAVNIYNNELSPEKYQFDSNIKSAGEAYSGNKFEINFKKVLNKSNYSSDDFLKKNHIDIYDVSDQYYMNEGWVDSLKPFRSSDKVKSYDFTVTLQ